MTKAQTTSGISADDSGHGQLSGRPSCYQPAMTCAQLGRQETGQAALQALPPHPAHRATGSSGPSDHIRPVAVTQATLRQPAGARRPGPPTASAVPAPRRHLARQRPRRAARAQARRQVPGVRAAPRTAVALHPQDAAAHGRELGPPRPAGRRARRGPGGLLVASGASAKCADSIWSHVRAAA